MAKGKSEVTGTVEVSLTETPQFQRLARFLWAVEHVARVNADEELQGMVGDCRADLLAMTIGDYESEDD